MKHTRRVAVLDHSYISSGTPPSCLSADWDDQVSQQRGAISQIPPNTATAPNRSVGWELSVELLSWPYIGGRYWDRTSDLLGVNEALSR